MGRTQNFWQKKGSPRGLSPDFYLTFPGLFPMFHHISITPRSTPDHPQIHPQINPRSTPRSTPDPPPAWVNYHGSGFGRRFFPLFFGTIFFSSRDSGALGILTQNRNQVNLIKRACRIVFFQRWMPSHEKLVRPSAPDRSFGKGQAASNSIPQRPNGLCTCSWLPCVTV